MPKKKLVFPLSESTNGQVLFTFTSYSKAVRTLESLAAEGKYMPFDDKVPTFCKASEKGIEHLRVERRAKTKYCVVSIVF